MEDWLAAGVPIVCVVLPATRSVVIHRAGGESERLSSLGMLRLPELIPEFSLPVESIFPPRETQPAAPGAAGG